MRLNEYAKAELRDAGVSQAEWGRTAGGLLPDEAGADPRWSGDACGCPDSRCIGYHHFEPDDCGCLPVLLEQYLKGREGSHG